jgi:hypothetical protein
MADVRLLRRQLWRVLAVFAIIDLAALIVLVSPISSSSAARQQNLKALWSELQKKTQDTLPTHGIEQKLDQAKNEINVFYQERFPDSFATISDRLVNLARASDVQLLSAGYRTDDTDLPELRRVSISARIAGNYTHEVEFINALERSRTCFLVDSVDLSEAGGGPGPAGPNVALQIGLETYLRIGAKTPPFAKTATVAEKKTNEPPTK